MQIANKYRIDSPERAKYISTGCSPVLSRFDIVSSSERAKYFAPSGLYDVLSFFRRATPFADILRPFRAVKGTNLQNTSMYPTLGDRGNHPNGTFNLQLLTFNI